MKKQYSILVPLFLVALLYLPFLPNDFISDDITGIVDVAPRWTWIEAIGWPRVIHLGVLLQFWTYKLFGLVPWPFRLTNILFHMGNVVLVWAIVKKLSKPTIAFVASILFAIHPLVVESVTWISGGVYAQYTFFFLLSFFLYICHLPSLAGRQAFATVSFLLSLFISEKAVPLVLVCVVYEWVYGNIKKNWKRLIPYCIVSIGFILFYITRYSTRISNLELSNYQTMSGLYNPLLQIPTAISSYLELYLFPMHLTLYHALFRYTWWEFGIRAAITVGYLCVTIYALWKRKYVGFWFVWIIISLGVTLLPVKIAWIVAERYVYCGLIGLCMIAALVFDVLLSKKQWRVLGICFGIGVVMVFSTRTLVRNSNWRSADTLWPVTLRESPTDPHSWNNMGDVYGNHGEYEKSIQAFTKATTINPNYAEAYHNIGNTYIQMKRYEEAVPFYEKALSINPNLWQSYHDLGVVEVARKQYEQAIVYFEKAISINSHEALLWKNTGFVYVELGNKEKGKYALEQALRLDPADPETQRVYQKIDK